MAGILRRTFLIATGSVAAAAAGGALWVQRQRANARIDPLVTDPDATEFVYRDGWIVPSDAAGAEDVRQS